VLACMYTLHIVPMMLHHAMAPLAAQPCFWQRTKSDIAMLPLQCNMSLRLLLPAIFLMQVLSK
jgi:hypothetical protein